ncbi:PQ loop repeat-domain-containing protein [Limtongia smithiae]|uniref:PQ loop repeat-domain-containing protein n=1 Tax=Limtongia smithiae TaxID=1125753 RepID=UPI0034CD877B
MRHLLLMSKEALSLLTGSISIACWAMVFSPQLYDIFRRQNADNLSVSFLWLWFVGDLANILGCILQETLPTMTILAVYNTLADIVLIFQAAYYRRRRLRRMFQLYVASRPVPSSSSGEGKATVVEDELHGGSDSSDPKEDDDDAGSEPVDESEYDYFQSLVIPPRRIWKSAFFKFGIIFMIVLSSLIGLYCATNGHLYDAPMKYYNPYIPISRNGQICGWFCASIYVTSRIPQVVLNYKQKSCERMSLIYFLFASGGNLMFITSILALDNSLHYLLVNSSWLCGTFCSLILDYMIVFQSWHYDPDRLSKLALRSSKAEPRNAEPSATIGDYEVLEKMDGKKIK